MSSFQDEKIKQSDAKIIIDIFSSIQNDDSKSKFLKSQLLETIIKFDRVDVFEFCLYGAGKADRIDSEESEKKDNFINFFHEEWWTNHGLEIKIANLSAINILLFLDKNSDVLKITLHYYQWLSGFLALSVIDVADNSVMNDEKIKSFFEEVMDTSKFTSTITSTITSTDEKINDMYQCSAKMD